MERFFGLDSPVMRMLNRLADLIILNLLTVVCALPVVTAGASAAGLYTAMQKLARDEGSPVRDFFRGFRRNFKQATLLWLILLASGALIVWSLLFYAAVDWALGQVLLCLMAFLALLWSMTFSWVFPLQASFCNSIGGTLRNALLCAAAYLPRSAAMAVLNFLPLALALLFPYAFLSFGVVWLLIWFSLAAYLNVRLLKKPYARIAPGGGTPETEEP